MATSLCPRKAPPSLPPRLTDPAATNGAHSTQMKSVLQPQCQGRSTRSVADLRKIDCSRLRRQRALQTTAKGVCFRPVTSCLKRAGRSKVTAPSPHPKRQSALARPAKDQRSTLAKVTGMPVLADSVAASAIAKAATPSAKVTGSAAPSVTAATKAAHSAA